MRRRLALAPKSSAVFTRPVPKISCHIRFTVTRAVSGCSSVNSHLANPSRFFGRSDFIGGRMLREYLHSTSCALLVVRAPV